MAEGREGKWLMCGVTGKREREKMAESKVEKKGERKWERKEDMVDCKMRTKREK